MLNENKVLEAIEEGHSANSLLLEKCPTTQRRFDRLCKSMVDLLKDIRKEFPDAQYYTASGGLNLLLGSPHDAHQMPQRELVALESGYGLSIGDGDF